LDGIGERKLDFWLRRIGCESKDKSLEYAQQMKEEAENKLKDLKAEKEVCEKNIDKILKDNIERLEKIGIDVNNAISPKQLNKLLKPLRKVWNIWPSYRNNGQELRCTSIK
jgi:predicted TIM-barrel fold metal-dependent hydrolase